ncbi:MAG: hypothetical protein LBJ73_00720 [Rickettsiales bacterium]|nr:hypothetical protein [Rickettsiales bacterium]
MTPKRLFLFAAFDPKDQNHGIVDDSLLVYLSALNELGDVVLYMDNDVAADELNKVAPFVLHAGANRHKEYDFGSYKRAYIWASENLDLSGYDWVYMVNDSVYAPLRPLGPLVERMESSRWDATGATCNPNPKHPHIQSWFIGMSPSVFAADWFGTFMRGVARHNEKGAITRLYEQGFTRNLIKRNIPWGCAYTIKNRGIYNRVARLFHRGFPFMKKLALTRHNGALGRQILYVLNRAPAHVRSAVIQNAERQYGREYVSKLLTRNPFKILFRNIRYALYKSTSGGF